MWLLWLLVVFLEWYLVVVVALGDRRWAVGTIKMDERNERRLNIHVPSRQLLFWLEYKRMME